MTADDEHDATDFHRQPYREGLSPKLALAGHSRTGKPAAAALTICLILEACSTPAPPIPAPTSTATPRPGALAWSADFTSPSIGVGLECSEDVPPRCFGSDAPWLTFNRPGTQGQACVDPGPNACYSTQAGTLKLTGYSPGWPLFTRETFDGAISVEAVAYATCTGPGCYFGPVVYNGEMNYRAVYFAAAGDRVQAWLYAPVVAVPLSAVTYPQGTQLTLRVDYDGVDTWRYYVNGELTLTETPGSLGPDRTSFSNAPHLSVFMGEAFGGISRLDVYK